MASKHLRSEVHARVAPEKLALCRSAVSMMRLSCIAGTSSRSACSQMSSGQGGEVSYQGYMQLACVRS